MNAATPYPAEAADARLDGRISSAEATFAVFVKLMDERHRAAEARMDRMEVMMTEIRSSISSLRTTIIVTAITSVFAVAALFSAMQANMLAAVTSGKDLALMQVEVKRQVQEATVLLKHMQEEKDKPR